VVSTILVLSGEDSGHTDLSKTIFARVCFLDDMLANVPSEDVSVELELFIVDPVHEPRT
jgi:hypothetical protein